MTKAYNKRLRRMSSRRDFEAPSIDRQRAGSDPQCVDLPQTHGAQQRRFESSTNRTRLHLGTDNRPRARLLSAEGQAPVRQGFWIRVTELTGHDRLLLGSSQPPLQTMGLRLSRGKPEDLIIERNTIQSDPPAHWQLLFNQVAYKSRVSLGSPYEISR